MFSRNMFLFFIFFFRKRKKKMLIFLKINYGNLYSASTRIIILICITEYYISNNFVKHLMLAFLRLSRKNIIAINQRFTKLTLFVMSNRHQIWLCCGPTANRAAALPTVLSGQEARLSPLQPLPGRDREIWNRAGWKPYRAGEGTVRTVPEARRLGGGRHPERFSDLTVRRATQFWRQGALRRSCANCEKFSCRRAVLSFPQQLLLLQVKYHN